MPSTTGEAGVRKGTHTMANFTNTFGTEIEFTGMSRQSAAQTIAKTLSRLTDKACEATYLGTYYKTWGVEDNAGRTWKVTYDSSIRVEGCPRNADPMSYRCELVTPVLTYEDMGTLQEIIRDLRKAGARVNNSCGQHVHIGGADYTAQGLVNIINLMGSHQELLADALAIEDNRSYYCKPIESDLIKRVNSHKNATLQQIEDDWYKGYTDGRTEHYNSSRYHMINLHAFFHGHGTVEFRCFNSTMHAGEVRANITLCLAMDKAAREAKRVSAKPVGTENEKFTMRTWMNRMGLIGEEYKAVREHLMKHLEGNAAWSSQEAKDRHDAARQGNTAA